MKNNALTESSFIHIFPQGLSAPASLPKGEVTSIHGDEPVWAALLEHMASNPENKELRVTTFGLEDKDIPSSAREKWTHFGPGHEQSFTDIYPSQDPFHEGLSQGRALALLKAVVTVTLTGGQDLILCRRSTFQGGTQMENGIALRTWARTFPALLPLLKKGNVALVFLLPPKIIGSSIVFYSCRRWVLSDLGDDQYRFQVRKDKLAGTEDWECTFTRDP